MFPRNTEEPGREDGREKQPTTRKRNRRHQAAVCICWTQVVVCRDPATVCRAKTGDSVVGARRQTQGDGDRVDGPRFGRPPGPVGPRQATVWSDPGDKDPATVCSFWTQAIVCRKRSMPRPGDALDHDKAGRWAWEDGGLGISIHVLAGHDKTGGAAWGWALGAVRMTT